MTTKDPKESMTNYVTKKQHKYRDLIASFEENKITCAYCNESNPITPELPNEVWSYLLRRGARLSEEQRKLIHQWGAGVATGDKLIELLLRLDRIDTMVAQSLVKDTRESVEFRQVAVDEW